MKNLYIKNFVTWTNKCKLIQIADDLNNFVNPQLWAVYTGSKAYLEQFQLTHQEFLHNEALKKFRFDCLKAIITPVNALNAATKEHLMDKYNRITNFLLGKSLPNVRSHPQGISFSIYTLAKKLVASIISESLRNSKLKLFNTLLKVTSA